MDQQRGIAEAILEEIGQGVRELSALELAAFDPEDLREILVRVERLGRQMDALVSSVTAAVVEVECARGRSVGSAAVAVGREIGVPAGEVRRRAEAGARESSAPGRAVAAGEITASQERAVAAVLAELPVAVPPGVRRSVTEVLMASARAGANPRALVTTGEGLLAEADPSRLDRLEEIRQRRRSLRLPAPDPADGMTLVQLRCGPGLRAQLDSVVSRFGAPGRCLGVLPDVETGGIPSADALAGADDRTQEQRAYDALVHVLGMGLAGGAGNGRDRGPASVVVRLTAEQLDAVERGESGGVTVTDGGAAISAREAVAMAEGRSWFLSTLRAGVEELRRVDVDARPGRRLATELQRLVLYAAHGGCSHPGCDAPAARCQVYHIREFTAGGPTATSNLTLVCPTHHGWVSEGDRGWRTVTTGVPGAARWVGPGESGAESESMRLVGSWSP